MSLVIKDIIIDCADPKNQAEFWSAALGWEVLYVGGWDAEIALGSTVVQASESWSRISIDLPNMPNLVFQRVPERKTAKNRLHFDLNAGDMESQVSRLVALGASVVETRGRAVVGREQQGEDVWTVMEHPEGNEFCVG